MSREVVWKLVVDETGAIRRMEEFGKEAEKTDKTVDKTKKSADDAKLSIKNLGGAFSGLKSVMGAAAGALGFAGIGFGLESVISKTSELAKETETFHNLSGMGTKNSLYYVAALKARGVSSEAVAKSLARLAKNFQTAERQQYSFAVSQEKAHMAGKIFASQIGVQAEAFQSLGLSVQGLQAMSPEKRIETIIKAMSNLKNPVVKARDELQLFGKGGTQLANVLVQGTLGLEHQRHEAEKFFPTLKGGANVMNELIAKQAEGKMAWEGLEFTMGTEVAPAVTKVIGAFSGLIAELDHGKGPFANVESFFSGVAKDATSAAEALGLIHKKGAARATHHSSGGKGTSGLGHALEAGGALGGAFGAYKLLRHPFSTAKGVLGGALAGLRALGRFAFPAEGAGAAGLFGSQILGGAAGLGAFSTGASIPFASAALARKFGQLFDPGFGREGEYLREHPILGGQINSPMAYGPTHLEGHAAAQTAAGAAERAGIAARNAAIEAYARQHHESLTAADQQYERALQPIAVALNVDGRKLAEVFIKNPNAQRYIAEAAERAALNRNARR